MTDAADRLIVVRLANIRLAMDLAALAEVAEIPASWPIPLAPACFRGVMNFHGRLVPLLDLANYIRAGTGQTDGKALVLVRRIGDLAIWVDEVERIISSDEAVFKCDNEDHLLTEVLDIGGVEVFLLNAAVLVEALASDLQGVIHTPHPWQEAAD